MSKIKQIKQQILSFMPNMAAYASPSQSEMYDLKDYSICQLSEIKGTEHERGLKDLQEVKSKLAQLMEVKDAFVEFQDSVLNNAVIHLIGKLTAPQLGLEYIGSGAARSTFLLNNKEVIKLTIGPEDSLEGQHKVEVLNLAHANSTHMQYAPELKSFDEDALIMTYIPYPVDSTYDQQIEEAIAYLESQGFCTASNADIYAYDNWRIDAQGKLYLIDWGSLFLYEKD